MIKSKWQLKQELKMVEPEEEKKGSAKRIVFCNESYCQEFIKIEWDGKPVIEKWYCKKHRFKNINV